MNKYTIKQNYCIQFNMIIIKLYSLSIIFFLRIFHNIFHFAFLLKGW